MRSIAPLAVALLASLAACVTPLTAGGARVRLVEVAGPEWRLVGEVKEACTSELGGDLGVVEVALVRARNRTAEDGADTLVLSPPQASTGPDFTGAVYLGTAYRCRPEASPSR